VDRAIGDYAKIVCLDDPMRLSPTDYEDQKKYTQHGADVISIKDNVLSSADLDEIFTRDIKTDKALFASLDTNTANRLRELGHRSGKVPYIFDFKKLLKNTEFPPLMRDVLALLSKAYDYPVDIEFTANFSAGGQFKVNLLQCRPLQTRGLGKPIEIPKLYDKADCFFSVKGNFMGGNIRLPLDYVVYVDAQAYKRLNEQNKYAIARQIGVINACLKDKNALLIGPGRWGTTTPSLGVPVHFTELCNMSVICELSSPEAGFMPELSYGSHFFQDLVETGIFYVAIMVGHKDVSFEPGWVLGRENQLAILSPQSKAFSDVIHISRTEGMEIFSDVVTQTAICR
jgi:hypothetical protein